MPNVGKTSLYNLITNKNNNIIHDTIGTTRDWHVSPLKSNGNIDVFDTPGIINQKNLVTRSISNIIRKIDIFVYVIDYKDENYFTDKEHLDDYYGKYLDDGFEGQMVRVTDSPYQNKRSKNLLKRKEFIDEEFEVIDIEEASDAGHGQICPHRAIYPGLLGHVGADVSKGKLILSPPAVSLVLLGSTFCGR